MVPSARVRLSLAIVLAGLAVGVTTHGHSFGDASTYVLMADSLWNDGDLVYGPEDFARAEALHFGLVPLGLLLTRHDWGYGYGKSFVYPALAVPFYAALGPRGFFVLNGLLLAAIVLLAADVLSQRIAWRIAVAVAAAVIGFSVTPLYVEWIDPFLACSMLAAAALAAYRRKRPALSAALLVSLAACRPPYLALAAAPLALYAIDRDKRSVARFAAAGAGAAAIFLAVGVAAGEAWTPYAAERLYYIDSFPYDGGESGLKEVGLPTDNPVRYRRWPDAREIAQATQAFLVGRFAGVLVYFPGLLACAFWSHRWDREKIVWAGALAMTCAAIYLGFRQNYFGGVHAIGNRIFTLLPIAFVFVDFIAWRPWRVLASAALATLVLPVVRAPLLLSLNPGRQMSWEPYRHLPLEWSHIRRMPPPFTYPGMAALTDSQYAWESNGVWTRGGTTAEFVFIRSPGRHPRVRLYSPLADVRISDGGVPVAWHPNSVVVELTHPVATTRDDVRQEREADVYMLSISTDTSFRPRANGGSNDNRYLGVYVQPLDRSAPTGGSAQRTNPRQVWWALPPG